MIKVTVNGESMQLYSPDNLNELLKTLRMENSRIAIELNRQIIPHSQYAMTAIREGDRIEIITAIGGG